MNESLRTPPSASTRRGGYTRQKRGCLTCRQRYVKGLMHHLGRYANQSQKEEM